MVEVIDETGEKKGLKVDLLLVDDAEPIRFKVYSAEPSIEQAKKLYLTNKELTTSGSVSFDFGDKKPGYLVLLNSSSSASSTYDMDFSYLLSGDLQANTFELNLVLASTEPAIIIADIFVLHDSKENYSRSDLFNEEKATKIASTLFSVKNSRYSEFNAVADGIDPETVYGDRLVLLLTKEGGLYNTRHQFGLITMNNGQRVSSMSMR